MFSSLGSRSGRRRQESSPGSPVITFLTHKFTADGTYVRSDGCVAVDIVCVGGGGGGSGAKGSGSEVGLGSCGGGGGTVKHHLDFTPRVIEAVTQAATAVVTAPGHGYQDGTVVRITAVVGMTQLNGNDYTVANRTDDTFELDGVNSTGFDAYVSGGFLAFVSCPVDVGAGGQGGTNAPGSGAAGETSSFGGYCAAEGGEAGYHIVMGSTQRISWATAGGDGAGDLVIPGGWASRNLRISGTSGYAFGFGGSTPYGAGGPAENFGDGQPGSGYGAGGGSVGVAASTGYAGAAGQPGLVLVTETILI